MSTTLRFFILYLLILTTVVFLYSAENVKLKNGVTIVFDNDKLASTTAVQMWVAVGSVNEDKKISGISHFIEHLIFKGTPTRNQKQIAPEIEKVGGVINAATSKDYTYFYSVVPASYSLKSAEILADVVLNPLFPNVEIEKERKVILEEIKRKDDNPGSQLFDEFYEQVYTSSSPYSQRVIGTATTVSKLSRNDFLLFHKKFYTPENIVIVISGNFNKSEIYCFLKNTFGKLEKSKERKQKIAITDNNNLEGQYKKIIKKDVSQTYLAMGFSAADVESKDQYALDIASYILGGGRASRLHKKLVEEASIAYGISASFATHKGPGLFYICAECSPENTALLSNRILLELNELTVEQVTDAELNRAKTLLIRDKLLQEQTPDGKADEVGFYTVLGNGKIAKNYLKNIKKVKARDIKSVLSKYLLFPNIPTVIITAEVRG